jgi:hypothetical protein
MTCCDRGKCQFRKGGGINILFGSNCRPLEEIVVTRLERIKRREKVATLVFFLRGGEMH